ncbi:hypothetical protein [Streptomyces sp. NPDC006997]|uniref:hypothetical protein n=1 Tax=Streptomyces sp. NPDC006997 TaxID=3155356 RepID=UPI0033C5EB08
MSTEAQRAPVPPRPPRPTTPPHTPAPRDTAPPPGPPPRPQGPPLPAGTPAPPAARSDAGNPDGDRDAPAAPRRDGSGPPSHTSGSGPSTRPADRGDGSARPTAPRLPRPSRPASGGRSPVPAPPPPPASARFPDTAPPRGGGDTASPEAAAETTTRLRPVPPPPDPALSWGAMTPPPARPVVTLGQPETYDDQGRPRSLRTRLRGRTAAAVGCVVLGLGLIGGAVTGSWLTGDSGEDGGRGAFTAAGELWHSTPVDRLFPPTVQGRGAGPGGSDRAWTRIAVAPDGDCAGAFDPLLRKVLAPVGCARLLRATYTDATQSHVTTVGLLFTGADVEAMRSLDDRFAREDLDRRGDLVPRPYAAEGTAAARFGPEQRATWTISVLTDAPVVVYAVSGWADARTVDEPEPAAEARASGATSAAAQAGLGHEAQGLADRVERALRKNATSPTEQPS